MAGINIKGFPLIHDIRAVNGNMRFCVEFFFIIAGFFLFVTFKKNLSVIQFLKNKFIRLSPVIIFTVILFAIIAIFKITKFYFIENIFSIFFLNGIEIVKHKSQYGGYGNVHSSWYVSTLVCVSLFYFYIIKSWGMKLGNMVIFICILLGLYWLSYNVKTCMPYHFIRGSFSVGIGILLGELYIKYKNYLDLTIKGNAKKFFFTILETGIAGYLLYGIITTKSHLQMTDLVFLFVILFLLFIKKGGYLSRLLDNNLSVKLGSYSYSIYITHCLWLEVFKKYYFTPNIAKVYPQYINGGGIVLCLTICIVFGIFTYYLVEKPCTKYLKKRFNKGE